MKKISIIAITITFTIIMIFTVGSFKKELSLNLAPIDFSYKKDNENFNSINVTGAAKRDFTSDIIAWSATYSTKNMNLKDAYKKIDKDRKIIEKYLSDNSIPTEDMLFNSITYSEVYKEVVREATDTNNRTEYFREQEFDGYNVYQSISVESKSVEAIEALSRDITTLIDLGVEIQSNTPYYFYSKLEEMKIDMIAEATKNAQQRALMITENSNSHIGRLLEAQMGVFQIIAKNSTENYTWGGTHNITSRNKTAAVTMKLTYEIGEK